MKKLFFIAMATCAISSTKAQITTVPKPITKIPKSIIILPPTIVVSRTMGNYPERKISVRVWIEDAGDKGFEVKFAANTTIEKVEINRSEPQQVLNTFTLAPDKTSGSFYMDAPSYKGSNTYQVVFYAPGLPKGVWTALIQRKKS